MDIKKETSSGGIVYKKTDKGFLWLVTQHSQHKGWVFPKGLIGDINENEKMEDAALREVEEEGGVKARIINPHPVSVMYSYTWNDIQVDKTVFYYLMEYVSGDPANHDWEMMDAKFMTEAEAMKILTYPSDQEAFEEILEMMED
ncbi:MAG: NUDIX domain-containing protein [Microgenomates group bacterium]